MIPVLSLASLQGPGRECGVPCGWERAAEGGREATRRSFPVLVPLRVTKAEALLACLSSSGHLGPRAPGCPHLLTQMGLLPLPAPARGRQLHGSASLLPSCCAGEVALGEPTPINHLQKERAESRGAARPGTPLRMNVLTLASSCSEHWPAPPTRRSWICSLRFPSEGPLPISGPACR